MNFTTILRFWQPANGSGLLEIFLGFVEKYSKIEQKIGGFGGGEGEMMKFPLGKIAKKKPAAAGGAPPRA